jgi:hypothetical protein
MNPKIPALYTLIKGIMMALLGTFHIAAFFIIPDQIFAIPIPANMYQEFAVWFNLSGVLFIYIGINDISTYKSLRIPVKWARTMAFTSGAVTTAFSFAGILVFREGPPFLIFTMGLLQLISLFLSKDSKESDLAKAT